MLRNQEGSSRTRAAPHRVAATEGRQNARFAVTLPVRCRRLTARASGIWNGRTVNVGSGGFTLELPTRLPPGTLLAVEVRTGIGPLRMEAEVLWTRCIPGRVGITRHGLCLAGRSEILDLPIGILLGQWLQGIATREGKGHRRADAPTPTRKRRKAR